MSRAHGSPLAAVAGTVAPGFEPVREAFAEAVASQHPATGAALAATHDGRLVVDLWAGATNPAGMPWQEDTLSVLFSGTKGLVASAMLWLADRRELRLTDRVSDHWIEFGASGKADITIAQLCAHAAGLPWIDQALDAGERGDLPRLAALLAAQGPVVEVGRPCYHAITFGWLTDGLARRVHGRPISELVGEVLAAPLGLDLRIGLGDDPSAAGRVARLHRSEGYEMSALSDPDHDPRLDLVYGNPPLAGSIEDDSWLLSPVPAANGLATARAVAELYGALVTGLVVGMPMLAQALEPAAEGNDPLSGRLLRFGPTGFELQGTPSRLGPPADAFGHTGAGGSSHGGWPQLRAGFSFVTSEMRNEDGDGRAATVLDVLHGCMHG